MKIFVTGTRGIPEIPGGVEKHCQELYPLIAAMGHDVVVATRKPYVKKRFKEWKGVHLIHIYAPKKKNLEAIVHTFLTILKARLFNPDIIHIHAVGPSLLVPLARLLGLNVVVTNHGPDYDRQKWGRAAKIVLRLGEYLGGKFAHRVIVISGTIAEIVSKRCGIEPVLIYNGVPVPQKSSRTDFLEHLGIMPGKYVLAVARFVPEKGLHDLIKAFQKTEENFQLVIAGDADHETEYSRNLKKMATEDGHIILTGYITGEKLRQIFCHARIFCQPSYHEGLPIALLEALSYGLPVLISDIPANKEVELPAECFFICGDISDLKIKLKRFIQKRVSEHAIYDYRQQITNKYNWLNIAQQTVVVYEKVLRQC